MLLLPMGESAPQRLQGAYISDDEIKKIIDHTVSQQIAQYDAIEVFVKSKGFEFYTKYSSLISRLVNASSIVEMIDKPANAAVVVVGEDELSIPLGEIDVEEELDALKKELDYTQGFLNSVSKKLSNERFVQNAPEQVVANEKKKMADAEARIKALEESIAALN